MSGGNIDISWVNPDMPRLAPTEIGLVEFPGVQTASVLGLSDLFAMANAFADSHAPSGGTRLAVTRWAVPRTGARPQRVGDDSPISRAPTVLVMPPRLGEPLSTEEATPYVPWLIEQHGLGTTLASVCGGAFLLAETGLLSGRMATTHWTHAVSFAKRFPETRLEIDRLLIDDGDLVTAGGLMAWVDLGLRLVDRYLGPTVMTETARFMLVDPPGREQRFYSVFSPSLTHGDAAIVKTQHWLQATGAKDVSLATLASMAALEERTFLRRFRKATGLTPVDYCQRLRVGKARELLEFGTLPLDAVAWQVGYTDPGAFRKIFTRVTGLTPGEYRRRFGSFQMH